MWHRVPYCPSLRGSQGRSSSRSQITWTSKIGKQGTGLSSLLLHSSLSLGSEPYAEGKVPTTGLAFPTPITNEDNTSTEEATEHPDRHDSSTEILFSDNSRLQQVENYKPPHPPNLHYCLSVGRNSRGGNKGYETLRSRSFSDCPLERGEGKKGR